MKIKFFHKSPIKSQAKQSKKKENNKTWQTEVDHYHKYRSHKKAQRARKRYERAQWRHSSKTFNSIYNIFFNLTFYAKQCAKSFLWLFFLSFFPRWTISQWMRGLIASTVPAKTFFAELTSIQYWNLLIVATTLFACWKIIHLRWTPPAIHMTLHDMNIIKRAKHAKKHQLYAEQDKALLHNAKSILNLNKHGKTDVHLNIQPSRKAIHHAKNKMRSFNRKKHSNVK